MPLTDSKLAAIRRPRGRLSGQVWGARGAGVRDIVHHISSTTSSTITSSKERVSSINLKEKSMTTCGP